jgi:hypothetical protein
MASLTHPPQQAFVLKLTATQSVATIQSAAYVPFCGGRTTAPLDPLVDVPPLLVVVPLDDALLPVLDDEVDELITPVDPFELFEPLDELVVVPPPEEVLSPGPPTQARIPDPTARSTQSHR